MNIWFVSPNGQPRGPRARIHNFATRLVAKGCTVTVFCKSHFHGTSFNKLERFESFRVEIVDGVKVVWINAGVYRGNGFSRLLSEVRFTLRVILLGLTNKPLGAPSVIVADSVTPINSAVSAVLARIRGCKFVHQIRDVWPAALVADGSIKAMSVEFFILRALERYSYWACDWICSALPNVHAHIADSGGDATRITYIRNGVDLDDLQITGGMKDRGDVLNVTYVGTISFAHDLLSVVRAFAVLSNRGVGERMVLNVYGDGVKREQCQHEAEEKGLNNVRFHGMIDKSQVPSVLADSDLLVVAVLESDAYQFGANLNKMYDYFAAQKPILLSGTIPNDDVVAAQCGFSVQGECPLLIADVLEQFAKMAPSERAGLGLKARRYAEEHYDVNRLADSYFSMLSDVTKGKFTRKKA